MWRKTIAPVLLGMLVVCEWTSARHKESEPKGYSPKSYKTATMSAGASYSSPMSTDRKTIIKTREDFAVAEEIYSPNKEYYAYADLGANTTTVYRIAWQGNTGRRQRLWAMNGSFEMLGLTNDGRILVTGIRSDNLIPKSETGDLVMLTFVDYGKTVGRVKLNQILVDPENLPKVGDHYYWGDYWGLNALGHYVVKTVEGKQIQFDVRTGEEAVSEAAASTAPPGWRLYKNIMGGYEFGYPENYLLKESKNHEGRPTGESSISNAKTGWTAHISVEHYARTSSSLQNPPSVSFESFVVERARLMSMADGPDSSRYATDVLNLDAFQTGKGLQGIRFSLLGVHETHYEGENSRIEKRILGPFYALQLSGEAEPYRALFLRRAGWEGAPSEEDSLLTRIIETVRVIKP